MPKYRIYFEWDDEVEAEDELEALLESTKDICEWIGMEATVEEIEDGKWTNIRKDRRE